MSIYLYQQLLSTTLVFETLEGGGEAGEVCVSDERWVSEDSHLVTVTILQQYNVDWEPELTENTEHLLCILSSLVIVVTKHCSLVYPEQDRVEQQLLVISFDTLLQHVNQSQTVLTSTH